MLVTTSPSGDEREARELANRFGLISVPRGRARLDELLAQAAGAPLLLLSERHVELIRHSPSGVIVRERGSQGMAILRLSRAMHGEIDPLVRVASLIPGDRVLDATLGLGGDALIAAHATQAPLLAFEHSPLLAAFTQASLHRATGKGGLRKAALEAGARIEVQSADYNDALAKLADQSFDVVLFDPMFLSTVEAAPVFDVVRAHANPGQLSMEALAHARRIARRGVLVKDSPRGKELRRLGLAPIKVRRFLFGWADAL
jgi:16S rRNA (guanine1516-N2)-methyltransferase